MKTFSSFSFGCRVNQAEKEALDRQLLARGYTYNNENPDVYVINTCSVTHKAEREARQMINQVRAKHADTKIVIMGCAATNWIKTKAHTKDIDLLVENPSKEFIAELIEQRFNKASKPVKMPQKALLPTDKYIRSGRIMIKIQDGCQRYCTYCIVPYLRGMPSTPAAGDIIKEINSLPKSIKEVIFTAINTEAYGYDTKKEDFADLIQDTLDKTTIERISFGSIHPWSVNDKLFSVLRDHPQAQRIVKFFHVPLQSGNNKMLNLMKRGYTREEFLEKLHTLNNLYPFTFIGTDIIVGFLEETDADFEDTYTFLEQTPINKIHIFRYSERQHTAASYMAKRLQEPDSATKVKRAQALAELNRKKYHAFIESHIGHTFNALFLEEKNDGFAQAVLDNQIPVLVKTDKDLTGTIHKVTVESQKKGALIAQLM